MALLQLPAPSFFTPALTPSGALSSPRTPSPHTHARTRQGTFHKRRMPTAFYPMIGALPSPARVTSMLPLLTSPRGFCVNTTAYGAGNANSTILLQLSGRGGERTLCASDACLADALGAQDHFVRAEGLVQAPGSAGSDGVPLELWVSNSTGAHATVAGGAAGSLPPGFARVRVEGECFGSAGPAGEARVPLVLWQAGTGAGSLFRTCAGNPACHSEAAASGYAVVNSTMCWGYNGTTCDQLPCKFSLSSTAREDSAWLDNNYWRGRIWGSQVALVWLGLRRYGEASAARSALVQQALRLGLQDWRLFRQVSENMNSIHGAAEDGANADPFYTWGALLGHVALLDAGY